MGGHGLGSIYQNTTAFPKMVMVSAQATAPGVLYAEVENATPPTVQVIAPGNVVGINAVLAITFVVPVGWYYRVSVSAGGALQLWAEYS